MKLKLDDSGNVIVRNDKPVYETSNGNEIEFDALSTTNTIQNLTRERDTLKGDNKTLSDASDKFKDFDIDQANKDRETIKNFDDKKLVDAGEVEKIKAEMGLVFESEKSKLNEVVAGKDVLINDLMIGSGFAESAYLRDNVILPPDMCRDSFGKNFKIEEVNGKPVVVGYLGGNKIYSQTNAGELAGFEESIQTIVGNYAMKDRILKSSEKGGSGGSGGGEQAKGDQNSEQKIASGLKKLIN